MKTNIVVLCVFSSSTQIPSELITMYVFLDFLIFFNVLQTLMHFEHKSEFNTHIPLKTSQTHVTTVVIAL